MTPDELTAIVRREFIDQVRDLDNPHWKAQTPDYLKEVCAKAGYPKPDEAADFFARAAAQAVRKAVIKDLIERDVQIAAASISGPVAMRVNQRDRIEVFKAMLRSIATEGKDNG